MGNEKDSDTQLQYHLNYIRNIFFHLFRYLPTYRFLQVFYDYLSLF